MQPRLFQVSVPSLGINLKLISDKLKAEGLVLHIKGKCVSISAIDQRTVNRLNTLTYVRKSFVFRLQMVPMDSMQLLEAVRQRLARNGDALTEHGLEKIFAFSSRQSLELESIILRLYFSHRKKKEQFCFRLLFYLQLQLQDPKSYTVSDALTVRIVFCCVHLTGVCLSSGTYL